MDSITSDAMKSVPIEGAPTTYYQKIVDEATLIAVASAFGEHSNAYEEVFGQLANERPTRTTKATVRPGHNFLIPLGDESYAPVSKYLFINKVKVLKRNRDYLRCQMTLLNIDKTGNRTVEDVHTHVFRKGELVFAFGSDIEEHLDKTVLGKRVAVASIVTIAGVVVEEVARRHKKHSQ